MTSISQSAAAVEWPPEYFQPSAAPQLELVAPENLRSTAERIAAGVGASDCDNLAPPHQLVFRLARHLQGELPGVGPTEPAIWHATDLWFRAVNGLRWGPEYDLDACYAELVRCWDAVRSPVGQDPVMGAWQDAASSPPPAQARRYTSPRLQALCALVIHLAARQGDSAWWVSCRTAARLLACSPKTASGLLKTLVRDGVIVAVGRSYAHKATRYKLADAVRTAPGAALRSPADGDPRQAEPPAADVVTTSDGESPSPPAAAAPRAAQPLAPTTDLYQAIEQARKASFRAR